MITDVLMKAPLGCNILKNAPPLNLVQIPAILDVPTLLMEILLKQNAHYCITFLILAGNFPSTQKTCWGKDSVLSLVWQQSNE